MVVVSARHQQAPGSNPDKHASFRPFLLAAGEKSSKLFFCDEEEGGGGKGEGELEEPKKENESEIVSGGLFRWFWKRWIVSMRLEFSEWGDWSCGYYGCVWSFLSLDHNGSFLFFFIIFPFLQGKIALRQFTDKGLDYMLCLSPLVAHGVFRIDGRMVERKLLEFQRFFVTLKLDRVLFVSLVNYGAAAAAAAALSLRNS